MLIFLCAVLTRLLWQRRRRGRLVEAGAAMAATAHEQSSPQLADRNG